MALLEREEHLARLRQLFLATRDGRGRLALVAGEAGIGKTAVIEAFRAALPDRTQVLWGGCDAVVPARAFAPIADIAAQVGEPLAGALEAGDRDLIFQGMISRLRSSQPLQRVVVIEDLHWADEATLDLLRVIGRRLREIPVLIIGTYRDDEVTHDHPLRLALGDIPADGVESIVLPPLTVAAVRELTAGTGVDAIELHRATGGNAFFVTEVASSGADAVPTSVRDAVFARASRLSPAGRAVLEAGSVLGQRFGRGTVRLLARRGERAVHECEASAMLKRDGDALQFRHELAQRAVLDGLSASTRRALHRRALNLLAKDPGTDPAELARHAVGAGDARQALAWAPVAARRAAALGAHRQAAAHYAVAQAFVAADALSVRAELLEREAGERMVVDEIDAALELQHRALTCWRQLGDVRREADGLRALSLILWFNGANDEALEAAQQAVDLLGALPAGPELARAEATLAQRLMTTGRDDTAAADRGMRALSTAKAVGDEAVAMHATTTIGVLRIFGGDGAGWEMLEENFRRARAAGLDEEAVRAIINLVEMARDIRRYELADRYYADALQYLAEHNLDMDVYRRRLASDVAEVALERGRWDDAAELTGMLLGETRTAPRIRVRALTVLGRLRARRGDPDAWPLLEEGLALAGTTGDVEILIPLHASRIEAALLARDATRAGDDARLALALVSDLVMDPWSAGEIGFWAWRAGALEKLPEQAAAPFALHHAGHFAEAAEAWQATGCPYQAALALADSPDEREQRQALEAFIGLGAAPMAREVARRLHGRGARDVRRGPRRATLANPAQLTSRELEVLALLVRGLRNAEIADQLVLSVKTVDHHVSSILRKLGVPTRAAAATEAARLGLKDGETAVPR